MVTFYLLVELLKSKFGVQAFKEALLIIPKCIYANSGHDHLITIGQIQDKMLEDKEEGIPYGFDVFSGQVVKPLTDQFHENYGVKKQIIETSYIIASNLLLVDEIMRAGLSSLKG